MTCKWFINKAKCFWSNTNLIVNWNSFSNLLVFFMFIFLSPASIKRSFNILVVVSGSVESTSKSGIFDIFSFELF